MNRVVIRDAQNRRWLQFLHPRAFLQARSLPDVMPLLEEIQRLVQHRGLYAAGWIGYEAAPAFDDALRTHAPTAFPLACFGLFDSPSVLASLPPAADEASITDAWRPSVSRAEYEAAIARIRERIAAGDTYQVNYTLRQWCNFRGNPWDLFLRIGRGAPYAAFLDTGLFAVCSASPELFFRLENGRLISKPMKGTAPRGRTLAEDRENALWLHRSEKNRAENVMIVDMVRNDMGRIARYGSVRVPRLYDIEKYPTLWQMTSTVESRTVSPLPEILKALFPCASITGAPKPKTMGIIAALETTPRRIYTGAIGYYGPDRRAQFNVAIRTVLIDKIASRAEYGVGGGIVWDSTAEGEYEECMTKAKIILAPPPHRPFSLLETLRWTRDEGFFLLSRHLERLHSSALYFDYPYDERRIRKALADAAAALGEGPCRVRLLLAPDGAAACQSAPLEPPLDRPLLVRLAKEPVHSRDPFLFHKTTRRKLYETARAAFPDADDVLLYNEAGEVTESCIANLVILSEGRLVTPPVDCGLLGGVFRSELLEQGVIYEEKIGLAGLKKAEKIYLINSVRKWQEALLAPEDRL
ncbi:MAG: aminodeoxychorismate synthase component I [Proteobacteria bacterium]|nr:aminodeoxychorismate synthase component I [Pseudomonadota bacterium]